MKMRLLFCVAVVTVLLPAIAAAQEPGGMIIRNPYYHAAPPAAAPTTVAPYSPVVTTSYVAPPSTALRTPTTDTMQALRRAVQSPPAAPSHYAPAASFAPGSFVPAADAKPIVDGAIATSRMKDVVAANLEVTRLSPNPLRDEPTPNASTLRIVNPLR
jgi:hypothetical protein